MIWKGRLHFMKKFHLYFFSSLFAVVLLLTACGARFEPVSQNSSSDTESPATSEEVRAIQHAMDDTRITGTPQRIVTLQQEATDALLALGLKPVGAVESWVGDPWYDIWKEDMEGVAVVGSETQPDLEKIAALQPDLILGSKLRHEKIYEQLSAIAPTVFTETIGMTWKDNFKQHIRALNREAEGNAVLEAWERRVADFKEKMGDKLSTKVSIVRFRGEDVRIYDGYPGSVIREVGLSRPESQQPESFGDQQVLTVTKEQIPLMDGDIMFVMVSDWSEDKEGSEIQSEWTSEPLWQNLNVVKNNKVFIVDEVTWNLAGGIGAANRMLDDLYKYFNLN